MKRYRLPITFTALLLEAAASCQIAGPDDTSEAGETSSASAAIAAACNAVPSVVFTPSVIPVTPTGVPVTLDVAVTNTNPAECEAKSYNVNIINTGLLTSPRPAGTSPTPPPVLALASGATGHLALTVTAPASADGGDVIPVTVAAAEAPAPTTPGGPVIVGPPTNPVSISFPVAIAPGCQVSTSHELMIRDLSVVDDPVRTVFTPGSRDPRNGVWTLKHLAESMARTPADAPAMIEAMLSSIAAPQIINGFSVVARPGIQRLVLASWPRTATGALDLAKAPLHLLAIVNRFDLRDLAAGNAGEGRFVFSFDLAAQTPPAPPPQATIIFEYKLPALRDRDVMDWAMSFHRLGSLPFGEVYNLALQAITERFTRRGARPQAPNGSAINAVRTNEIPFDGNTPAVWELREFHLSAITGRLEPATVELTPDLSFLHSATLASYLNANQAAILAETHVVPPTFNGAPFLGGAVFNEIINNSTTWVAPGVDPEVRHHFAINTCNGCHSAQETGTGFLHLTPRTTGTPTARSGFLTGIVVDDPVTGTTRTLDDLGRRKADMKKVVCRSFAEIASDALSKGISRVH